MDEYMGIIKFFAGNFAPKGFMFCQGQILSISQNTALFSLLGTIYGGDGQTTFALPNFSGRVPVGTGNQGGTNYQLGQIAGSANVTLLANNMPTHTHTATATSTLYAEGEDGNTIIPEGNMFGNAPTTAPIYVAPTTSDNVALSNQALTTQVSIGLAGGSQPFSVMNPYLAINYLICTQGLYPSRN